jgi:hypothetical protein
MVAAVALRDGLRKSHFKSLHILGLNGRVDGCEAAIAKRAPTRILLGLGYLGRIHRLVHVLGHLGGKCPVSALGSEIDILEPVTHFAHRYRELG